MPIHGITHEYGPWSPTRFLLLPDVLQDYGAPAFYVTTSRMCRGLHDWRCTQAETQTFGPLVLAGKTADQLTRCPNCERVQPPVDALAAGQEVCLFCTDMATVQRVAVDTDTTAALSAAAALHAASSTLRLVKEADPDGYLALLDDTGDVLRGLMDDAAWAVKQDPNRAKQAGYRAITAIARQVSANAREYASMHIEPMSALDKETEGS